MLEFITRPIRSVLGVTEHDVVESVHEARDIEANMLDAVHAIENATASIEHHVEVIETLATSVDPLRASVGASSVDTTTPIRQGKRANPSRSGFVTRPAVLA